MVFQEFYKTWFEQACFTSNQVYSWRDGFDKNNLGRWVRQGLVIKLRNGLYTFPEYLKVPDIGGYVANRMYLPSYISLHTALNFHGLIPEAIIQYSSITSLKTKTFKNPFGTFVYKSIKPECYFGYDILDFDTHKSILMATPEKAILDLLYLYPFYKSEKDFMDLRFDKSVLEETVNKDILIEFAARFNNKSLIYRINNLMKTYLL